MRTAKASTALLGTLLFGVAVVIVALTVIYPLSESSRIDGARPPAAPDDDPSVITLAPDEAQESVEPVQAGKEELKEVEGALLEEGEKGVVNLKGFVVDEADVPVAGVSIRAVRVKSLDRYLHPDQYDTFETQSAQDGWFAFKRVPVGTYSLIATHDELAGFTQAFTAGCLDHPDGIPKDHEIVLYRAAAIAGKVVDRDSAPIAGALVIPTDVPGMFATTDAAGAFTVSPLRIGLYTLQAAAPGMAGKTEREVPVGKTNVEIRLTPGGKIKGVVTLEGKPKAGIVVSAHSSSRNSVLPTEAKTASDGSYELGPLAQAPYSPSVVTDRYTAPVHSRIQIVEGETREGVDFKLEALAGISGTVKSLDTKEPLRGIWVCAFPKGDESYHLPPCLTQTRTDGAGRFSLPSLAPTEYKIGVKGTGAYMADLWNKGDKVELGEGETRDDIHFELKMGGAIEVAVKSDEGATIRRAKVNVYEGDPEKMYGSYYGNINLLPMAVETEEGLYRFEGLKPGLYRVTALKRGWMYEDETVEVEEGAGLERAEIVLEPSFGVHGKVFDPEGVGVAGACVDFWNKKADLTADDGSFTIQDMGNRWCRCRVKAEGFFDYQKQFNNLKKDSDELVINLKREGSHFIAGKVKNDEGDPVPGVKITITQRKGENRLNRDVVSGDDGSFRAEGLAEDNVYFNIDMSHGKPRGKYNSLPVDQSDVEVVLERFGVVKGTVLDESGKPAEKFTAYSRVKNTWQYTPGETFEGGTYELKKVLPGEVTIHASTKDHQQASSEPIVVEPGKTVEGIELRLSEVGSVSGTVFDGATMEPVAGAAIHVSRRSNDQWWSPSWLRWSRPQATSESNGTFTAEGLKPGNLTLVVNHPDYKGTSGMPVTVVGRQEVKGVEIYLATGCMITGYVTLNGQGKSGVHVNASSYNSETRRNEWREGISGKAGRYTIRNLTPGEYSVSANIWENESSKQVTKKVTIGQAGVVHCDLAFFQGGSVQGVVYLNDQPMEGARLSAYPSNSRQYDDYTGKGSGHSTSQKDGSYRIENLPPGDYNLRLYTRGGERRYSKSYKLQILGGPTYFDIHLGRDGFGEVWGYVYVDGVSMPEVGVSMSTGGASSSTKTDITGFFRFTELPAGNIRIRTSRKVRGSNHSFKVSRTVKLLTGESVRQDLHLNGGTGVLYGSVLCNSEPARRCQLNVSLRSKENNGFSLSAYARDGEFRVEGLPPGEYDVRLYGNYSLRQTVTIANGRETRSDFSYRTGDASLQGTVAIPKKEKKDDKIGAVSIYLFQPGALVFEEGKPFFEPSHSQGLITIASLRNGKFKSGKLPSGPLDVVAVRHMNGKTQKIDVKSLYLVNGKKSLVDLNVAD